MADKIYVYKKNEVYNHVVSEPSVQKELSEFFTFYVPNYTFSPKYRSKQWDGKIRLYDQRNFTLYSGLFEKIEQFAKERGYVVIDQRNEYENELSVIEAQDFIKSLAIPNKDTRDYQFDYFIKAIRKKRVTIISPTASGKSMIIYLILRYLMDKLGKKKGLLIVPQINLVDQMFDDFKDYGWDADKYCYKLTGGISKDNDKAITISTWQSVYTQPESYFEQFDFFTGDEAQYFQAKSLKKIGTALVNCDYRISTTGSLDGKATNQMVIEGLFGPVIEDVTTKQLIDAGYLSQFQIKCLLLRHNETSSKHVYKFDYNQEIEWIFANQTRNNFIANLACSLNGNTLVLFSRIEHGKELLSKINNKKADASRKIFFIYGKIEKDIREEIRQILMTEKNGILVASFGTWAVGANLPNLHNIIFAAGGKSRVRNLQSIGRALRLHDSKEIATLFDIVDDLRYKNHVNFTLKHFLERMKIYNEQKFVHKIYKIQLKKG
jgi:superfamily II DNA or RNA helicase